MNTFVATEAGITKTSPNFPHELSNPSPWAQIWWLLTGGSATSLVLRDSNFHCIINNSIYGICGVLGGLQEYVEILMFWRNKCIINLIEKDSNSHTHTTNVSYKTVLWFSCLNIFKMNLEVTWLEVRVPLLKSTSFEALCALVSQYSGVLTRFH